MRRFFGIGAYAVAIGPTHLGHPALGGASHRRTCSSALLAYLVGAPDPAAERALPRHRHLGLGVLVALVITTESRWTGGPDGMPVARLTLFGWRVSGAEPGTG